jgi:hypothetical protein
VKALCIVFISAVVFASGCKRPANTENSDFFLEEVEAVKPQPPWPMLEPHPTDPSSKPAMHKGEFISQFRMIADFDGNGMLDIGLPELLLEADSYFAIYLRMPDGYKNAGIWDIDAGNPTSVEYVTPPCFSRLWSSGHISSSEIFIKYTELKNGMIVTNSTCPNHFELSWGGGEGDEEGNKLPNALDSAIFNNSSSPIWWETSVFTNGVFQWVPFRADLQ